jgi:hypothetical protein
MPRSRISDSDYAALPVKNPIINGTKLERPPELNDPIGTYAAVAGPKASAQK